MDLLRHLTYFVAVAEELHFGRAAARLHMAQPPLSQRVRRLEEHLGVKLFERSSRRVDLTPAGQLLLPEARELLAAAERLEALAERFRDDEPAELRAGVLPALAAQLVADTVQRFTRGRPDVRLELRETPDDQQLADLRARRLDVGLVRRPADLDGLRAGPPYSIPLGVLAAEGTPAARAQDVELAALAGLELVLFPRDTAPRTYDELLADCRAHGFAPAAVHAAGGLQVAAGLVLTGQAVALAEPLDPPAGCVWRPLAGAPLQLTVSAVWHADAERTVVDAFASALTGALQEHGWRTAAAARPASPATPVAPRIRPASGLLS